MSPNTRFILVCLGTFTGFLAIGIPLPVIPNFIHDQLGFGMFTAGIAIGAQSLATVVTRRLAGGRADNVGSRPTTRTGYLAAALGGVCYLAATAIAPRSESLALAAFLAGRVMLGLGESLLLTGALIWGIGLIGPAQSGRVMSWNGIAMYGALAFGAPVGIFLQERLGFTAVALVAALAPLVGFCVTHFVRAVDQRREVPAEVAFVRTVRAIWAEGAGLALATVGFGALSAFVAVYFRARGWSFAGAGLLLFGGCYIAVRLLFGDLPDRIGGLKVAAVSLLIEAAGQLTLWLAPSATVALIGVALTGLGFSLIFPSFGVQALRRVPPEGRGTALGAFSAFFDVALGLTGPLCGLIIGTFGVSAIYGFGTLAASCALALVWIARR